MGFRHFVGIDGSLKMLELAKKTGLYQQLTQCLLGQDEIPVESGNHAVDFNAFTVKMQSVFSYQICLFGCRGAISDCCNKDNQLQSY